MDPYRSKPNQISKYRWNESKEVIKHPVKSEMKVTTLADYKRFSEIWKTKNLSVPTLVGSRGGPRPCLTPPVPENAVGPTMELYLILSLLMPRSRAYTHNQTTEHLEHDISLKKRE